MSEENLTKAYYVERVSRTVSLMLVYAENTEDAKRRSAMEGDRIGSESYVRGYGQVRRAPEEDR